MPHVETISAKQAASWANTHDQAIRRAVKRGLIQGRKEGGRLLIVKESFENWRRRLEIRRELRLSEHQLVNQGGDTFAGDNSGQA
jgi:hypothetical protein